MSAYGALLQGQMTNQSLQAQAGIQTQNAAEAEAQGQFNATEQGLRSSEAIGKEEANFGASGVTATSGSVQNVLAASNAHAELDRLNILHGADIKAINYQNQASMDRYGGQSALLGSYFSAFGSVAQTGLQVGSLALQGAATNSITDVAKGYTLPQLGSEVAATTPNYNLGLNTESLDNSQAIIDNQGFSYH